MAGNGKKRKKSRNGSGGMPPRPTKRDLRLAGAIAESTAPAIAAALAPEFEGLRAGLESVREEVAGVKTELSNVQTAVARVENEVRQLRDGAVGIGRMTALEARVTELERKQR
jgi:hypothetical protein